MGLDMYVFTTSGPVDRPLAFSCKTALHYWRKHYSLHRWMYDLYRSKGGCDVDLFVVPLAVEDIERLEHAVTHGALPPDGDLHAAVANAQRRIDDLGFIAKARHAFSVGLSLFYIPSP